MTQHSLSKLDSKTRYRKAENSNL